METVGHTVVPNYGYINIHVRKSICFYKENNNNICLLLYLKHTTIFLIANWLQSSIGSSSRSHHLDALSSAIENLKFLAPSLCTGLISQAK